MPGVIKVFTYKNRPKIASDDKKYQDQTAPPGSPMRPLGDEKIAYAGQPIALVVAETFELARHAATLVHIEYETKPHKTDLEAERSSSYEPKEKRSGIAPPPRRAAMPMRLSPRRRSSSRTSIGSRSSTTTRWSRMRRQWSGTMTAR